MNAHPIIDNTIIPNRLLLLLEEIVVAKRSLTESKPLPNESNVAPVEFSRLFCELASL